jgi:hypothetical protein
MQINKSKLASKYVISALNFVILASLTLAGMDSQATVVRKVFDGTAAYCPPKEAYNPIVPETALRAEVDGQELVITLNVCELGQWKLDTSLPTHRYTAPGGATVELQYEKFQLVIQSLDWSKTKFIPLPNFSGQASARLAISDIEFVAAPALDISLTAVRTTKTSSGHTFVEDVHWGALRLQK